MPKSSQLINIDENKIREKINDYEFTCQTIAAMSNIISYNLGGECTQGKEMRTSSTNSISPNTKVTPDLIIEVPTNRNSDSYHAVNEIKVTLPRDETYWIEDAKQLKKYDDDLSGWTSPNSALHDVMFTTNELLTYAFQRYLNNLFSSGKIFFTRKLSILHSTHQVQKDSFIIIKKDSGEISNRILDDKLSNGVAVPELKIIKEISQMKFYDSDPPIVYTMMVIWDHVLKNFLNQSQLRDLKGNKIIPITVTIEEIREKLSRFAPDPSNSCIRKDWVREALTAFVEIEVAKYLDHVEKFEIDFKPHKGSNWIFDSINKKKLKEEIKAKTTLDKYTKENKIS